MSKGVSLALALTATAVLMLAPFLLVRHMTSRAHAILPAMLVGISGAFAHGLGFRPDHRIIRLFCSPIVTWTLIGGGAALLVLTSAA